MRDDGGGVQPLDFFRSCQIGKVFDVEICPRKPLNEVELRPVDDTTLQVGVRQLGVHKAFGATHPWPVAVEKAGVEHIPAGLLRGKSVYRRPALGLGMGRLDEKLRAYP